MDVEKIPDIVVKYYKEMTTEIEKKSMPYPIYFIKTLDFKQSDMCYLMYGWYLQQVSNIKDDILTPIVQDKDGYLHKIKSVDWRQVFTENKSAKDILKAL